MLKLEFNTDPSFTRVLLIAFLLMLELILVKLAEILGSGRQPTEIELEYLLVLGLLQLVTFTLTFLRKEENHTEL